MRTTTTASSAAPTSAPPALFGCSADAPGGLCRHLQQDALYPACAWLPGVATRDRGRLHPRRGARHPCRPGASSSARSPLHRARPLHHPRPPHARALQRPPGRAARRPAAGLRPRAGAVGRRGRAASGDVAARRAPMSRWRSAAAARAGRARCPPTRARRCAATGWCSATEPGRGARSKGGGAAEAGGGRVIPPRPSAATARTHWRLPAGRPMRYPRTARGLAVADLLFRARSPVAATMTSASIRTTPTHAHPRLAEQAPGPAGRRGRALPADRRGRRPRRPRGRQLADPGRQPRRAQALLPFHAGGVKCIYIIDPPYNTRSAFEHYDDNLSTASGCR